MTENVMKIASSIRLFHINFKVHALYIFVLNIANRLFDWDRLNRGRVSYQMMHVKNIPLSKALSAGHSAKCTDPSAVFMTSSFEWNKSILGRDKKRKTNQKQTKQTNVKQSINILHLFHHCALNSFNETAIRVYTGYPHIFRLIIQGCFQNFRIAIYIDMIML